MKKIITSMMSITYDLEAFKKSDDIVIVSVEAREYREINQIRAFDLLGGELVEGYIFDDEVYVRYTVDIEFINLNNRNKKMYDYISLEADTLDEAKSIMIEFLNKKEQAKRK